MITIYKYTCMNKYLKRNVLFYFKTKLCIFSKRRNIFFHYFHNVSKEWHVFNNIHYVLYVPYYVIYVMLTLDRKLINSLQGKKIKILVLL